MLEQRIDQRIRDRYAEMSPQERKAADTVLEHLDELATFRASELAVLAAVSKATMSRLFRRLGFADFDAVRAHLRALRAAGEPRRVAVAASARIQAHVEAAAIAEALGQPSLPEAALALAQARQVLIVGWRSSYPVALHLRQQLSQIRSRVDLAPAPGQSVGDEVVGLGPGDVVVAVGIRRRPPAFSALLGTVAQTGATVIVLADPSGSHYLARADIGLRCTVDHGLAFDSHAAAMSLISLLADQVLAARGRPGQERISAISAAYDRIGEIEGPR